MTLLNLLNLKYNNDCHTLKVFSSPSPEYPAHININNQYYILTPEEIGKIIITLVKILAEHHVE